MTTRPNFIALALGVAMGLALAVHPALADNRPSDGVQFTLLNGEVSRELNSLDGGGLTLWTTDAGIGCNNVRTGKTYEMHCSAGVHFCAWSDGGCSSSVNSQAYGRPVAASSPSSVAPYYFIAAPDSTAGSTKQVCMTPASGTAAATCALFLMR